MNQHHDILSAYQQVNSLFTQLSLGMESDSLDDRVLELARQWFSGARFSICRTVNEHHSTNSSRVNYLQEYGHSSHSLSASLISSDGQPLGQLFVDSEEHQSTGDQQRLNLLADFYSTAVEKFTLDEEMRFHAEHDPLTHCLNRKGLIKHSKARMKRGFQYVASFFGDVDKFKQVNDQHGHDVGDAVLCQVGEVFDRTFKNCGLSGRLGGDEFVSIVFFDNLKDLQAVKAILQNNLSKQDLLARLGVKVSVGMAVSACSEVESVEALIKRADKEMYNKKFGTRKFTKQNHQENLYKAANGSWS